MAAVTIEIDEDQFLTEQILEIQRKYPGCSQRLIAAAVGCSQMHVSIALRTVRELELMKAREK